MLSQVPTHQRVRIICKDNFKYEIAAASGSQTGGGTAIVEHPGGGGGEAITNTGANHQHLHNTTTRAHLAPHHPHHPHHVQAAAAAAAHHQAHHLHLPGGYPGS